MPHRQTALAVPLTALTLAASYLAAIGLLTHWTDHPAPAHVFALNAAGTIALHLAWILPALRREHGLLVCAGWLVTVPLTADGLAASTTTLSTGHAIILEAIVVGLALAHAPADPWPERLARWRRTRERITTELRMSDGLWTWLRLITSRAAAGEADRPRSSSFDVLVANLARSGDRMHRTIATLALPEAVRESLRATAQKIVADAEMTLARMAIDLERRALDHAALCRDAILALYDVPEAERESLARDCESLILDLAHDVGSAGLHPQTARFQ